MTRRAWRTSPRTLPLRLAARWSRREFWRLIELAIERASGLGSLDTDGIVMLDELGVAAPERVQYQPSRYTALWRAMRGVDVTRDDTFLDYGCGKGRVLLQAAKGYPFGRVIGVEISAQLAEIARQNVDRVKGKLKVADVEVVVADATSWAVPDDVTYIFMYRPLTGKSFETVIERIGESLDRRPRRLTLMYVYPEQERVILDTGRFVRTRSIGSAERTERRRLCIYVSDPRAVRLRK